MGDETPSKKSKKTVEPEQREEWKDAFDFGDVLEALKVPPTKNKNQIFTEMDTLTSNTDAEQLKQKDALKTTFLMFKLHNGFGLNETEANFVKTKLTELASNNRPEIAGNINAIKKFKELIEQSIKENKKPWELKFGDSVKFQRQVTMPANIIGDYHQLRHSIAMIVDSNAPFEDYSAKGRGSDPEDVLADKINSGDIIKWKEKFEGFEVKKEHVERVMGKKGIK